ncbi:MAG: ATP-binding protein [Candidatus Paceibacterota bacterium]
MTPELQAYAVLIVASFNIVLTGIVLAQDFRDRTNVAFAMLTLSAALWGFGTGIFLIIAPEHVTMLEFAGRFNYFFGGSISTAFLYFSLVFAEQAPPSRRLAALIFFPTVVFLFVYPFSDFIIARSLIYPDGVRGFLYGTYHYFFDVHTWSYFAIAFVVLAQKYLRLVGRSKQQVLLILTGTALTFAVASVCNIVLPHVFGVFRYIWIGPVAIIFWIGLVTYAVARHQLFNIRVIAAELPIILLWLVLLFRAAISQGTTLFVINVVFLVIVLILGVFFIRSVISEVQLRELIDRQERELALVNGQQESLLDFISHEVKSYFGKIKAAFAGIGEGDYGPPTPSLKEIAARGLVDVRTGMAMVVSILDAANLKQGSVSYKRAPFDLAATLRSVVAELRPAAEERGLALNIEGDLTKACEVVGDEDMLRKHVLRNLIDNAIRYTISGSVTVSLRNKTTYVELVVADTGVGITPEDMGHLFTEGGHGKDSIKVNVHSTGYGLFIAKQVTEAQGGTIRAESSGAGKGSRFVVELPLTSTTH